MLKTRNLFFSYTGEEPYVLRDINMEIGDGAYVSVVGANGCGKTTLMRLMLGFLKPTRGEIISSPGRVGYVPQKNDFSNSSFPITVYEMLNAYRKLLKIKDRGVIELGLEKVGMTGFSKALMGNLSGGQAQRVMICRALMGNPRLLVLDEPSTGVDLSSQREIYGLIKELNNVHKITIVSVEHNIEAAVANSSLIYHMVEGQGHFCSPEKYSSEYLSFKRGGEGLV